LGVVEILEGGAYLEEVGHWGNPHEGHMDLNPFLSLSFLPSGHKTNNFSVAYIPCYDVLASPQDQGDGTKLTWTETSESMSRYESFSPLLKLIISGILSQQWKSNTWHLKLTGL
jgi:hypothetical protein